MEVVIVLGGPNTKEDIKALLENRYGKSYEDFRFVGVDGGEYAVCAGAGVDVADGGGQWRGVEGAVAGEFAGGGG